eukprot:3510807-Pyramimonas_sp.AAC.1
MFDMPRAGPAGIPAGHRRGGPRRPDGPRGRGGGPHQHCRERSQARGPPPAGAGAHSIRC